MFSFVCYPRSCSTLGLGQQHLSRQASHVKSPDQNLKNSDAETELLDEINIP